ncbi:MAG: hypothetical protein CMP15_04405 [Rickettsiales bacterium]|nr:hypothetical protein [Rickettsiales bacterium]
MKIKKIIYLLIIIFVFNYKSALSHQEIIPLTKSIKEYNLKSPIGKLNYLAYFSLRCGSLFSSINDVIPNNNYLNAALNLQEGAVITAIMIEKVNQKEIKERVDNKIQSYKSVYSKIIQENFYKNGEYINGASLIESDEKSCKNFVPRAYRFLKNNRFNIRK